MAKICTKMSLDGSSVTLSAKTDGEASSFTISMDDARGEELLVDLHGLSCTCVCVGGPAATTWINESLSKLNRKREIEGVRFCFFFVPFLCSCKQFIFFLRLQNTTQISAGSWQSRKGKQGSCQNPLPNCFFRMFVTQMRRTSPILRPYP